MHKDTMHKDTMHTVLTATLTLILMMHILCTLAYKYEHPDMPLMDILRSQWRYIRNMTRR